MDLSNSFPLVSIGYWWVNEVPQCNDHFGGRITMRMCTQELIRELLFSRLIPGQ